MRTWNEAADVGLHGVLSWRRSCLQFQSSSSSPVRHKASPVQHEASPIQFKATSCTVQGHALTAKWLLSGVEMQSADWHAHPDWQVARRRPEELLRRRSAIGGGEICNNQERWDVARFGLHMVGAEAWMVALQPLP